MNGPGPSAVTGLLVAGGGAAGLTAAIAAAESGHRVTLLDAADFASSASVQAQGGLSAVTAAGERAGDSVAAHVSDTLIAGAAHGDPAVVAAVCAAAAAHVHRLTRWGTVWDTAEDGSLSLTREAAHSARRILHCGGDATGAGLVAALGDRARELEREGRLELVAAARVVELVMHDGVVAGARVEVTSAAPTARAVPTVGGPRGVRGGRQRPAQRARSVTVAADAVLLATGGISGVFGTRTSRHSVPGDAAALAWRAGAALADLEMIQFHPTYCPDAAFMLTEALRGEGAVLVDATGRRFMTDLHEQAELAPRDVVARGVADAEGGAWLDAGPVVAREGSGFLRRRFPTVTAALAAAGLDLERDAVRVAPAEHYWMGGVAVDAGSRSTVPGLLVAGEAARTGLHGANRLASNSLLEAVHTGLAAVASYTSGGYREPGRPVTGALLTGSGLGGSLLSERAPFSEAAQFSEAARLSGSERLSEPARFGESAPLSESTVPGGPVPPAGDPEEAVSTVRRLADRYLGVRRDAAGLRRVLDALRPDGDQDSCTQDSCTQDSCAQDFCTEALVARLVATAALARTASLGAHARSDAAVGLQGGLPGPARPGATVVLVNPVPAAGSPRDPSPGSASPARRPVPSSPTRPPHPASGATRPADPASGTTRDLFQESRA